MTDFFRKYIWHNIGLKLAAVLIAIDEWLQWRVAKLADAAPSFSRLVPALVISICVFPAFAWLVSRVDAWRLGR